MLLTRNDRIAGHPPADVHRMTRGHVEAELTNDLERVMDTVSTRRAQWVTLAGGVSKVADGVPAVRDYYAQRKEGAKLRRGRQFFQVVRDWGVFYEGASLWDLHDGGTEQLTSKVMLLVDDTGVWSEIGWANPPDVGAVRPARRSKEDPPALRTELDDLEMHASLRRALEDGDLKAVLAFFQPDVRGVVSSPDPDDPRALRAVNGRDDLGDHFEQFLSRYQLADPKLWTMSIGDSHVMAEVAWTLGRRGRPQTSLLRSAAILPLGPEGLISGIIDFSFIDQDAGI